MSKQGNKVEHFNLGVYLRIVLLGLLTIILAACTSSEFELDADLELLAITNVAWGEQVQVNHPAIPASPLVTLSYRIDAGATQTLTPVYQQAGRVVFELPEVPELPALPNFSAPYQISASQYASSLTNSQKNQYKNRGLVNFTIKAGSTTIKRTFQPYGAVVSGELTVMVASANCALLASRLNTLGYTLLDSGSALNFCYATVEFGNKGTQEALVQLESSLEYPDLWLDKNTLFSLDPKNVRVCKIKEVI